MLGGVSSFAANLLTHRSPDAFSHAGTSTVLGIAEPSTGVAVGLGTTAALSEAAAVRLRATAARLLGAVTDETGMRTSS